MTSTAEFGWLCRRQGGAFTRRQANEHGLSDRTLTARCQAHRFQRLHRGVYADFSGPVPWDTRVWAAWLAYGPAAAVAGETALRRHGIEGDWNDRVVELDLPHSRRPVADAGVRLNRCRDFDGRLFGHRDPPLVRLEVAVLTVAARQKSADRALAMVLDVCRQGGTTPARLSEQLRQMTRLSRRRLLLGVLDDATRGVESFLEMSYLHRVERRHGLPRGTRQRREVVEGRAVYRDVAYEPWNVVVELDGRVGHADTWSAWRDMGRDNLATGLGTATLRFGYQLVAEPCATAHQVAQPLRLRGWPGTATSCGPGCTATTSVRGVLHT